MSFFWCEHSVSGYWHQAKVNAGLTSLSDGISVVKLSFHVRVRISASMKYRTTVVAQLGTTPLVDIRGGGHFAKLGLPSLKRINACLLPHPLREVLDSTFLPNSFT